MAFSTYLTCRQSPCYPQSQRRHVIVLYPLLHVGTAVFCPNLSEERMRYASRSKPTLGARQPLLEGRAQSHQGAGEILGRII